MSWDGKDRRTNNGNGHTVDCLYVATIKKLDKDINGNGRPGVLDRMTGVELTTTATHELLLGLIADLKERPKARLNKANFLVAVCMLCMTGITIYCTVT